MRKINIGIFFMILSIIIFLFYMKIDRKNKKEEFERAKAFVNEYIKLVNKYTLLPKEYRDIDKAMNEEEYNKYLSEMKEELSKYILESQRDYLLETYEKTLEYQYKGRIMYIDYDVEPVYNVNYKIVNGILSIDIEENIKTKVDERQAPTIDSETGRYMGKVKHFEGIGTLPKLFMLKKDENGEYKVILYLTMPIVPPQIR